MVRYERYHRARLLTEEEWLDIMAEIPGVPIEQTGSWWLCSLLSGELIKYHAVRNETIRNAVPSEICGIRPVFDVVTAALPYQRGDKVMIGNIKCSVITISRNTKSFEALADKIISMRDFNNIGTYINSSVFRNLIKN